MLYQEGSVAELNTKEAKPVTRGLRQQQLDHAVQPAFGDAAPSTLVPSSSARPLLGAVGVQDSRERTPLFDLNASPPSSPSMGSFP